jgi:hypothetical protein
VRKIALLAVIAAVAALGVTSVASGIQGGQGISLKLKSSKAGTAKKPRNIKLLTVVTTTTPTAAETGKFATRTATIFFDKNLVFNGKKFKSCTLSQVRADAAKCPKGSKVGTGSTTALFSGTTLNLTVTAYNGPGGKGLSLVVRPATGSGVGGVLSGVLKNAGGGYGKKLVVTIDSSLQNPLGLPNTFATLTNFTTKVGGVSKGVPYIGLKGCTGGKVKIKGVFAYTDGTSKTATNTTRCKK